MISQGRSQSGNFLRAFIQLGFTQGEDNRPVHDGAWPIIAGRRVTLNSRFALPDGALMIYQAGSEGSAVVDGRGPTRFAACRSAGILDRCTATKTCPKIIEHFGAAEIWGLQLSPDFVGTSADKDIPLPANVRRYYIPEHATRRRRRRLHRRAGRGACLPGHQLRQGDLSRQPRAAYRNVQRAPSVHFRNWVMKDTPPPASVWPTLAERAPRRSDERGAGISDNSGRAGHGADRLDQPGARLRLGPGLQLPRRIGRAVEDAARREAGDQDESGARRRATATSSAACRSCCATRRSARTSDGISSPEGFFKGQICNYAGGMIPFAATRAERMASGDPRPSLEERYTIMRATSSREAKAAAKAVSQGFLLQPDADALVAQASASNVLRAQTAAAGR